MESTIMLLDIETQRDFFHPAGSCYTPCAGEAARRILRLFAWARSACVPVLSTVLRVRPREQGPLSPIPHCVEGTQGEKKLPGTALPRRIDLGLRNTTDLPRDIFERYQQVVVEKRDTNIFAHARLERLITELPAVTFVLCGAGVARGVFQAAVGLRSRGFGVIVAEDAVAGLGDEFADMAVARMRAKGAIFAKTSEIVAPRPARRLAPFRVPDRVGR